MEDRLRDGDHLMSRGKRVDYHFLSSAMESHVEMWTGSALLQPETEVSFPG
jgi:hypothetical protein